MVRSTLLQVTGGRQSNSQSSHFFSKEVSARRVIMAAWDTTSGLGPKLCVASGTFEHNVLRMLPSDHNEDLKEMILGIKEHCPRRVC